MQVIEHPTIKGLVTIELPIYKDNRGFFLERFNLKKFEKLGLPTNLIQDNHSRSYPGVIRGLHAQKPPFGQGKLVGVINGRILDVAVDIRPDSPTFGQHFQVELSDENGRLLWMPVGFAHGFCVVGDKPADVFYKVDNDYSFESEFGIVWNDKELGINWPVADPIMNEKDKQLPSFAEYKQNPIKW
jgi:dTDP-4-dehydrorhamnose 3,5-epimerase